MVLVVEVEEATTMAVIYSPAKYIHVLLMVMVVEEERWRTGEGMAATSPGGDVFYGAEAEVHATSSSPNNAHVP